MTALNLQREIRRKAFHMLAGMAVPAIYYGLLVFEKIGGRPYTYFAKWMLLAATAITLAIDIIRLQHQFIKIIFLDLFGPLLRRHEITALTGATYLMISSLLCILLFDPFVAIASISYLVIGDALAAMVGRSIGRTKFFMKSFEGAGAGLIGCLAVGLLIMHLPYSNLSLLKMLAGAVTAVTIELLPIPLDDNIRVPLSAGAVMQWLIK
jgi:diacylglycerol kinase (CTP)